MSEFDDFYSDLAKYINEIKQKFVSNIEVTAPPESYELEVRAYCILAHAAFEEYFEQVTLLVMNKSFRNWLQPTPILNDTLLTMAAYGHEKLDYEKSPFENMKAILERSKRKLSNDVNMLNNGISNKHLAKILLPIYLQISTDANLQNSLTQLVKERGAFAHKGKIKNVLSPEDAKQYVKDCLELCDDIRVKAQEKFA